LDSTSFDAFLILLDSSLVFIATNDDGGAGTNSLITQSLVSGSYFILPTSNFEGETGAYTLTTQFTPAHVITFTAPANGSPNPVASAGSVALSATANDSQSHALSYSWTASCPALAANGSFSNPAVQSPNWTAPANTTGAAQSCNIEVTASDGLGLDATSAYAQTVDSVPHGVAITSGPSGTPDPVASEGSVSLAVIASDSLGHSINYAWSASCPGLASNGSFSNPALQSPSWTAPANTTGSPQSCNIEVTVDDGLGLDDTGAFSQEVEAQPGPLPVPALSPPPRALLPFLLLGTAVWALRRRQSFDPPLGKPEQGRGPVEAPECGQ